MAPKCKIDGETLTLTFVSIDQIFLSLPLSKGPRGAEFSDFFRKFSNHPLLFLQMVE